MPGGAASGQRRLDPFRTVDGQSRHDVLALPAREPRGPPLLLSAERARRLACASCGSPNEPGDEFCGGCGAPLARRNGRADDGSVLRESYTPKHLAEKILTSKAALEGERKQVTVLFADLKGSMELLADRDPEEARKLLDPVLERMMEAVHRYEGTVNQVMGDGIMALFGAPLAHEDHAVRACYAALRMQESVKKYADEVRRSHGAVVKIRVGLNSGEVVVRAIGSDLHMDYTAVGQTTHLAARMEQLADPGAIVITPDTLALAEGYVEVKSLGPVPVKGLADAVEVYEVTGAGPARTRLQAAARRGLTRFVGRDAELEQLRRAQQLARQRSRPGGGDRRRGGRGQVAPRLRVHPLASPAGLARPRERLGLVRQGDELPAGDRPPQGLLQDPGPGRPARDPREGDGQAAHAGRAWSRRCRRCWPCSTCPWTTPRGRRSTRRSAASGRSTRSSGCCSGRARCSRSC